MGKNLNLVTLAVLIMSLSFFFVLPAYSDVTDVYKTSQLVKAAKLSVIKANLVMDINKVAKLISQKGVKAFPEIKKLNKNKKAQIFVIDPINGRILLAPVNKYNGGKKSLKKSNINVKIVSQDARAYINAVEFEKKGFFSFVKDKGTDLFPGGYIAKTVIDAFWKVYMVFTHRNSLEMEKLFITRVVSAACHLIEKEGIKNAIKEFNIKNTPFRTPRSYMWIYDTDGVLVYNPLYPDNIGINIITSKKHTFPPEHVKAVKMMLKATNKNREGWIQYPNRLLGEPKNKIYEKVSYFKTVKCKNKDTNKDQTFIVGTEHYLIN